MIFSIDEPLAMLRSSATHYYSADGLGSVTSLTDGSGAVAASYTYDTFGNLAASSGSIVNPFRYTAREWDAETGQYFYRARYYNSALGRFSAEDPLQFFGGEVSFYVYAAQNPVNFTDARGLSCRCTYSQSSGHLKCVDSVTGDLVVEDDGYAGKGAGKNNPDMQDVPFVGPLPRGDYAMGPTLNRKKTGPLTIMLKYVRGPEPFPPNRSKDLMRIHGESTARSGRGDSSEGCIVVGPATRKKFRDGCGPGSILTVER